MRVLLLGGTAEARELAADVARCRGVSSLAGRVPDPTLPVGAVRIGGFGGVDGMRHGCRLRVDAVVDATHPYAATITAHAARGVRRAGACASRAGAARVATRRRDPGEVRCRRRQNHRGQGLFAGVLDHGPLGCQGVQRSRRVVSDPRRHRAGPTDLAAPPRLLLSRGPYRYDDEVALLAEHRVDCLVTKNSGGDMTRPKLDAAAALGVAVVMVERPPLPPGVTTVATVADAADWVRSLGRT